MMDIVKDTGEWDETQISEFEEHAKGRILDALKKIG